MYCTICTVEAMKLTTDRYEASRGLFATAELLVTFTLTLTEVFLLHTPYSQTEGALQSH